MSYVGCHIHLITYVDTIGNPSAKYEHPPSKYVREIRVTSNNDSQADIQRDYSTSDKNNSNTPRL